MPTLLRQLIDWRRLHASCAVDAARPRRRLHRMKNITMTLLLALCFSAVSFGAAHKFPADNPVASVEPPTGWKTEDYENGVELTSDDGEVYIAIEQTDAKNVEKSMDAAMKYLKTKGVSVDPDSIKKEETKISDHDAVVISWNGNDEEGPAKVQLMIVSLTDEQGALFIYWASPEGEQNHQKEVTAISQSLKKV